MEERTITTTYEDDVAVSEDVVDRIVPLNEEEQEKWDRMVQEAQLSIEETTAKVFRFSVFSMMNLLVF